MPIAAEQNTVISEWCGIFLNEGADIDEIGKNRYHDRRWNKKEGIALQKALEKGDTDMIELLRE